MPVRPLARPAAALLLPLLLAYDVALRPWMSAWGSTPEERREPLPGDEIVADVMTHCTKAVTIEAPPERVWPWLVQIGDRRAGFYSHDRVERFVFPGTVHYVERTHSATRIHPELQHLRLGDRVNTGSVGRFSFGNPVTVLEPNRALVIGTWAFVLRPLPGGRTRLLVRERDGGYLRPMVPRRFALARAALGVVDYVVGDPLHFVMDRGMMLGLKERSERAPAASQAR
ncbi:hypothetical protein ATJ97_1663 [Georgenia soli]|uniref:Polyketide cyclase/dehydrase/lipid transport protein n=1 Tax=Georgenia soli TaxID=638953 RepID=A0A2A9EJT5_9MICO|nr:hypothetical protein [Georgenia soli]PFG39168.1 hypothetical protein ATJ97_1663 [Georgenia soli]